MKELITLARTDDEIKLKILRSFEPLIKKCFKIYIKDLNYYDDTIQEGYMTILKCISNFNINLNCEFPGYVKIAVIRNIRDFSKKIKSEISLDEEMCEEGSTILDILKSDTDIENDEILRSEIKQMYKALNNLTEKQRRIIEEYYFKDLTLKQICKDRKCHYMSIARLKDRALKKLRMDMER